ncbi:hypothetical protein P5673_010177 [Acropora cervicornis]|uniref:Uncharacterized protein n=1 Tax=Acropora cervicornis TaxID=6130 RepID=A0AAD9QR80_ACRCE|nr:hypothetical protein P5673_010177 [Acropora cervicornis]
MTRDEKTNTITEKKALYRLEMRKEAPVSFLVILVRLFLYYNDLDVKVKYGHLAGSRTQVS